MAEKNIIKKANERLEEYKIFYPDATMTTISAIGQKTITHKEAFVLSKRVCGMTHSGLLEFSIFGSKMFIYKSKEFLKVADGFMKGAKVRFCDPRTPDDHRESVMLADGMRYDGGIPFIWTENSDSGCFAECNTFAVYWRPVEEDGK